MKPSKAKNLQITYRPIESLIPYARNSRTHSDAQVAQIAASIKEFGWTNPVLIDAEGGIIAGHGRIMAGRKLGITEAPCIVLDGLTEAQRRAYVIADNKLALNAGWDIDLLKIELGDLQALDFDLSLTGFDPGELGNLLADKTEGLTDPDAVPETPVNPVTVLGDVWLMGKHRLMCGDSTVATDVEALLANVKPHLMVTDPPYGVEYDATWRKDAMPDTNPGKRGGMHGKVMNDEKADWSEAWALFPGDVAYVWHAGNMAHIVAESLLSCGLQIRSQIIWAKHQFVIGRGHYHPHHEPCWYAVRKSATGHWAGDRKQSTLWQIQKPKENSTGHSTQKPVECMKRPIENNSSPGQAVYEPFSGSGTTIIAGEMTGRCIYAMELSPEYVDVAVKRWQEFTGHKATLESTGQTFEDVATSRYDWEKDAAGSYTDAIAAKRAELKASS
jgi:DNA modification methylase